MDLSLTSPNKTAAVPQQGGGVYYGKVTSVQGSLIFVEVPRVAPNFSFGPCRRVVTPRRADQNLQVASSLSGETVTSTISPTSFGFTENLEVGDEVVCAFIANALDEIVVLGRLA